MKRILIITGPTGVGKTSISIEVAKKIDGEIISADSMQIYRDMNIGTAKIKHSEMEGIPHHMIDIVDFDEEFSVWDYKTMSNKIISEIIDRKKVPMLVGGTGLYLNAFIFDRDHNVVPRNEKFREKMNTLDNETLYNLLIEKDADSEKLFHPNEKKKIIRALEIMEFGGEKPSILRKKLYSPSKEYIPIIFFIEREREELYSIINERVDRMMKEGLEEEVRRLYKKGANSNMQSMKGIGYSELIQYIKGNISMDEAIEQIKQHSRNYAKRQFTWFKKLEGIIKLSVDEMNIKEISNIIIDRWRENEEGNM